jgi:hypothetical protein
MGARPESNSSGNGRLPEEKIDYDEVSIVA